MRKRKIMVVALITLMGLLMTGCGKKKIDVTEDLTVNFDGYNGYGTAMLENEYAWESEALEAAGVKSIDTFSDLGDALVIEMAITYEVYPKENLSNGDEVTVIAQIDEDVAEEYKIKFVSNERKFVVKGLPEIETVDLFENIDISFLGIAPNVTANLDNANTDSYVSMRFKMDKSNNLNVGDVITVTADYNKEDLLEESGNLQAEKEKTEAALSNDLIIKERIVWVSAVQKTGIYQLKEQLAHLIPAEEEAQRIVGDLLSPSDFVVLVVPIDKAAPKGRLILPQQQTIRDILDSRAAAIVVKDQELETTLKELGKKPRMVITDSQVFAKVSAVTPSEIPLTSFSILFARYKGNLETVIKGVTVLESLKDGDHVLISEGCTHHRQCDDIGSVKIPKWIQTYTKKELVFEFTSGTEFPEDVSRYRLIVHCGGCMLNEREMKYRLSSSSDQQVPITNYGILIAYIQGILKRSLMVFPELPALLEHPLECREDE